MKANTGKQSSVDCTKLKAAATVLKASWFPSKRSCFQPQQPVPHLSPVMPPFLWLEGTLFDLTSMNSTDVFHVNFLASLYFH